MPSSEPIVVRDLKTLREVVLTAISEYGPSVDLNHLDVGGVYNFNELFKNTGFCGDVFGWDMSMAKLTNDMFAGTPFNGDLSKWNMTRLEEAYGMFRNSHFNGDVNHWNVKHMLMCQKNEGMFDTFYFWQELTAWNIANVCDKFHTHMSLNTTTGMRFFPTITSPTPPLSKLRETSLKTYASLFGGQVGLGEYLTRVPFGVMHFDACCASATCPVGITQENFKWSRELFTVGTELGLDNAELRALCISQLAVRGDKGMEAVSLDGIFSQSETTPA